jgi:hypothetical protein
MNPLPPLRTIHSALREITETLASELASPGTTPPSWPDWEWLLARAVAAMHGVSPLLSSVLRWQGAPEHWTAFLDSQKTHTAARFSRIRQLLSDIEARTRESGIAVVALKGAELHALGLYTAGERPMSDVDLLVRRPDMGRTARVLEQLGFEQTLASERHLEFQPRQHHAPAELGEHSSNDIKIELHGLISEALPVDTVDITDSVFPRSPLPGLNSYPSRAALMAHLLLHAAGAMTVRSVRLLHLQDISRLAARMTDADWQELLGTRGARNSRPWWAFPPLRLATRYFPNVPSHVLDASEEWCPRSLARAINRQELSELSYSDLWIEAFPGMRWAASYRGKMRYALSRLYPGKESLEMRAASLHLEPRTAQREWARLSQFQRILRGLTSNVPRVETISAVRAALEQSQVTITAERGRIA